MILTCNYEELTVLRSGARALLEARPTSGPSTPSVTRAAIKSLLGRLTGDLSLSTLGEQMEVERAVHAIVEYLRSEMDLHVLATHPVAEPSVAAYFDFAHALSVLGRVRDIGQGMSVLVEVMNGGPQDEEVVRSFVFPD